MFVDIHSHNAPREEIRTVYNIRINDQSVILPQGSNVLFSAGIHPWDVANVRAAWMDNMDILLKFEKLVAIGECGLDKNVPVPIEEQLNIFSIQIKLSELHKKPMIIHCVGCFNELLTLRKKLHPKQAWIIHGFRGKPELAEQLIGAGLYLSFGEFFNPETVRTTPVDRILVETDESDVKIEMIYAKLAALKHCRAEDLNAAEVLLLPSPVIASEVKQVRK